MTDGYVYYQPGFSGGNGYVGQTVQPQGRRESQHALAGKNSFGTMKLESNVPRSDLNSREAYHIGKMDTYKPYGSNLTRGNDLSSYHTGSGLSARATQERAFVTGVNASATNSAAADTLNRANNM